MSKQEELDWYNAEVTKKRAELDKARQAFFDIDAQVSRLESERSQVFRAIMDEHASAQTYVERTDGCRCMFCGAWTSTTCTPDHPAVGCLRIT